MLDFDYDDVKNTLTVSSAGFLEIENDALGYKISYLLTNFILNGSDNNDKEIHYEGSVLFTEMRGTAGQERRWQQGRQEVYEGSAMHFLRSAVSDRLEENGFMALRLPIYNNPDRPDENLIQAKIKEFGITNLRNRNLLNSDSLFFWKKKEKLPKTRQTLFTSPLNKDDIIANTDQSGIFAFGCDTDALLIIYNKTYHFPSASQLTDLKNLSYILNKPGNKDLTLLNFETPYTFFDNNGHVINPNSLIFKGAWARNRIASLLPVNYEVLQGKNPIGDTTIKNIVYKLKTHSESHITEKVYLHLDKQNYGFGDTIWYKAYTVVGEHHQLSALSSVLYVELISPKDSMVARQILPLVSGTGWSDIPLLPTLKQGNYRIRAYTNWMRNAGPDYFYNQKIRIGGIPVETNTQKPTTQVNPDVQFFPEGGELVNGIRSRIAFKAMSTKGLGEAIKGTVEDNEGDIVADFASQHLGMGEFAFTPQSGKTYKAKISGAGEAGFTVELPKAQEEGYTLALNNSEPDSIYIKVAVNEKTLNGQKNSTFYIIAQSSGKVYYTSESKLEGLVYSAKVEKSRFPSGIAQFTLFSQSGEPMAERVAFIQNSDTLKLKPGCIISVQYPRSCKTKS